MNLGLGLVDAYTMSNDPRPGYTASQIKQYYERINLPQTHRHEPGPASSKIASKTETGLEFLSALQRHNLASIPFENLDLHYSTHHRVSIDAEELFDKQVSRKRGKAGRGGYCMENNAVLANVLRGLGFNVISTGCRISSSVSTGEDTPLAGVTFSGLSHMVNLVSFSDQPDLKYHVDVGFGSGGPTFPIPLRHDEEGRLNVEPNQYSRLIHSRIPGTTSDQKLWVYEKRNGADQNFSPCYSFGEAEFLEADFKVMNHWTSTSEESWFTQIPVCVKMILDDKGEAVVGNIQIFKSDFKKRVRGDLEISRELTSESDRIEVLEQEFGIVLDDGERNGIRGMVSELK